MIDHQDLNGSLGGDLNQKLNQQVSRACRDTILLLLIVPAVLVPMRPFIPGLFGEWLCTFGAVIMAFAFARHGDYGEARGSESFRD